MHLDNSTAWFNVTGCSGCLQPLETLEGGRKMRRLLSVILALLVLPGILVGIWGYVIGTPLGVMIVELLG